jgi:uncharacterized protein YneF (UPF0154 family)
MRFKNKTFTVAAFEMALFFWVLESAIHYFVFEEENFEFIPSEMNELWMRVVIVFLIMLLGVFADAFIARITQKQMEVAHAYNALIQAGNETMDNLLQQMHLFKSEAQRSCDFNKDVLKYYDGAIQQASDLVERFENVDRALHENSRDGL